MSKYLYARDVKPDTLILPFSEYFNEFNKINSIDFEIV